MIFAGYCKNNIDEAVNFNFLDSGKNDFVVEDDGSFMFFESGDITQLMCDLPTVGGGRRMTRGGS